MRKTLLQIILLACTLTANAQIVKYDLNGDGKVNVADVTELANYILTHSNDGYKSCPDSNHPHWIDLGLPNGTKWRCCNEGASTPEGYGGYYEFGQVASAPSAYQIQELLNHTTSVWTTKNGVNGRKFTGSNGGTIFLPAAGYRGAGGFSSRVGLDGYYWSATPIYEGFACVLYFRSSRADWGGNGSRDIGLSVRPVADSEETRVVPIHSDETTEVQIYNMQGRLVSSHGNMALPAGCYIVRANNKTRKIIIK